MTVVSTAQDRQLLAESVRRCVRQPGGGRTAPAQPAAIDRELWHTLVDQVGIAGLLVPESCGGSGAGIRDAVSVLHELGATLAPVPALASIGMATAVLRAVPASPPADALLTRLADGSCVGTVAWPDPASTQLTPTLELGAGQHVRGPALFVLDGTAADVLLALAAEPGGVALVAVETSALPRRAMASLDLTRSMAEVELDSPATIVARAAQAEDFAPALDLALVAVAAELVGIAQHCLDAAVAYAKDRVQFGRPIGSFQAIKHLLVTLLMDLELARSAVDVGADAADAYLDAPSGARGSDLRVAASMAKAMAGDAAVRIATESLHVFGGIGFTWEHEAHLYLRRAKSMELFLGPPAEHRTRLAAALGVGS
jgi:alkylation response protein AidB-like acyl-CoA dehydrogenase